MRTLACLALLTTGCAVSRRTAMLPVYDCTQVPRADEFDHRVAACGDDVACAEQVMRERCEEHQARRRD